jgi:Domain of unknown function (DUF4148)
MKRHVIAVAVSSILAVPAFANNEIDAGNLPPDVATTKSREQVNIELAAAQRAGHVIDNAELGTWVKSPVQFAGKSRDDVYAELVSAQKSGDMIANGELGLTAREMQPTVYAGEPESQKQASSGDTTN